MANEDSGFEWIFETIDRLSGPAKVMSRSVSSLTKEITAGDRALKKFDETAKRVKLDRMTSRKRAGADRGLQQLRIRQITQQRRLEAAADRDRMRRFRGASGQEASGNSLTELSSGLGLIGSAFGVVRSLVGSFVDLGRSIMEVGSQAENSATAIAGMIQAGGGASSWNSALSLAEGTMSQIRRDAARLPGTAEDFVQVFQLALPKAMEAGLSNPRAVADFTNQFGAVGIALNIEAGEVGRDLNMLLSGRAGAANRTWTALSSQIARAGRELHLSAETAKDFNKLRPEQRLAILQRSIRGYGDMVNAFGGTWESISSTFTSSMQEIFRLGSAPLFDVMKNTLKGVNDFLERNSAELTAMAQIIGRDLAAGVEFVVQQFGSIDMQRVRVGFDLTLDAIRGIGRVLKNQVWPIISGLAGGFLDGFVSSLGPLASALGMISGGRVDPAPWRELGELLGKITAGFIGVAAWIGKVAFTVATVFGSGLGLVAKFWNELQRAFAGLTWSSIGNMIVQGLLSGIMGTWGVLGSTLASLVSSLPTIAMETLGIQSPSTVFAEIGGNVVAGFEQGIDAGAPRARSSMEDLVNPPGASGRRGSGANIELNISVQVAGGANAQETGRDIGEAASLTILEALELLEYEAG